MSSQTPQLRVPLRGELIVKLTQRFPDFDTGVIDVLNTLRTVSQGINDRLTAELARFGLTEGKFFVLVFLFVEDLLAHPAPRPSEIADNLGVTRATITGLLDGLERCGLIQRHGDDSDRRVLAISITPMAKTILDEVFPSVIANQQPIILDTLEPGERDTLMALLLKVEKGVNLRAR